MPDAARPRFGLQAIAGSDLSNTIDTTNDAQMDIIDAQAAMFSQGSFAVRPVSSPGTPGIAGRFYFATDQGILYYDHGTGWKEVRIGDVPLSDDDFAASAGMYTAYRTIAQAQGQALGAINAGTYLLVGASLVLSGQGSNTFNLPFRLAAADFAIPGRTTKLRLRAQAFANGTASGITFTVGLYPVSSVGGGSNLVAFTLGSVIAGSTVPFASPGVNSENEGNSGDFNFPSDDNYLLGVVLSGSLPVSSSVVLAAQLQVRHV